MEVICDSPVYAKELEADYLLGLHYLVSWKGYSKDKSSVEPVLAVQHLLKLVSTFHKNYPNKLIATSPPIDLALAIAKHIAPSNINGKRKRS